MTTLDKKHELIYLDFVNENIDIPDKKFVEDLKLGGFILDGNINELDLIRSRMYKNRFNTDNLSITIAPTMDCNFRCIYCYEKNNLKNIRISEQVQEAIIKYLKSKIKTVKNVHIT